jgi:site-specific DNA-methyltransferase (adenine-specific)
MISEVFLMDCMEGMRATPDKFYDLAVIDPPYGIGMDGGKSIGLRKKWSASYASEKHIKKSWDSGRPDSSFFYELRRVSVNQIIWGGNYFCSDVDDSSHVICWDKVCDGTGFSHFEIALTSYDKANRIVRIPIQVESQIRIHPTQKPIKLYSWIYNNYLIGGGKVIDTHLGSGSNRIAADKAGNIDFTAYEVDKDYYEAQEKRWKEYKSQLVMF